MSSESDRGARPLTYRDAGVDLDQYAEAMQRIQRLVRSTHTSRVLPLGSLFAGAFKLFEERPLLARRYTRPVLLAATDGVGTKLKVAVMTGRHDTVGIDLVAMSVNDCLALGGEPLFFLDYVAMDRDDPERLEQIVRGVAAGCRLAGCALLGGETAILPDVYGPGEYDLAGFCVAVAEERKIVSGETIRPGDLLIGLASSGLHSNGYSLVRRIVFDRAGLKPDSVVSDLARTVADVLLEPTRIYTSPITDVLAHYRVKRVVRGMAHITGGGIAENLKRVLPPTVDALVRVGTWPVPTVFQWLARLGPVEDAEMYRVFNMGLGMILVVSPFYADSIANRIRSHGVDCWIVGEVAQGSGTVRLVS